MYVAINILSRAILNDVFNECIFRLSKNNAKAYNFPLNLKNNRLFSPIEKHSKLSSPQSKHATEASFRPYTAAKYVRLPNGRKSM